MIDTNQGEGCGAHELRLEQLLAGPFKDNDLTCPRHEAPVPVAFTD
jgi:hypothetical protein